MKKYAAVCLMLVLLSSYFLAGCAENATIKESDIVGKSYVYEKEGIGGNFTISIMEDGAFSYYEGFLSSYFGHGKWTLDGNKLHLVDIGMQSKIKNFYFYVDGSDLVFISEESDRFLYIDVADGERFLEQGKIETGR